MKINNNLNVYDDNENIETKSILKVAIIVFVFFALVSIILTIFINHLYPIIIAYVLGSAISIILFKIIERNINGSYYEDLPKSCKRIHRVHQIVYLCSFIIIGIIFQEPFSIIALALGLMLMKISILINNLCNK